MNYFNPYYYTIPTNFAQSKVGLLGRLFGRTGISIGNFLNNTQRVLNIANQTIPLVKQVRPMIGNAKTVFKVMNEFKRVDLPQTKQIETSQTVEEKNIETKGTDEGPTFFV